MLPRRFSYLTIILIFAGTLTLPSSPPIRDPAGTAVAPPIESAPDQVLVGFEPGADGAARDAAVARVGGRTLRQVESLGVRLVELPPGLSVAASVTAFRGQRGVRYAEPNTIVRAGRVPNDPSYGPNQWGLHNVGQPINGATGTPGADIAAQAAWEVTTGSRTVVVGVLDSGIDAAHPDLAANLWSAPPGWSLKGCGGGTHGYDAVTGDCVPQDENGHGTHVAGTVGARGDNGTGVTGVNWTVGIMALRFLDASGSGFLFGEVEAIDYAVQAKRLGVNLRVLNASYGSSAASRSEREAIAHAAENGILFVAAAGNENANNDAVPSYPAGHDLPNIIGVAATGNRDELAGFSNYGATSVDLGAPGKDIASTLPTANYGYLSGTSMAAPHVAGAAALLLAAPGLGDLTVAGLRSRLLDCGDPLPALAGKTATGKRLNIRRALDGCSSPPPAPSPPATPTAIPTSAPVPPPVPVVAPPQIPVVQPTPVPPPPPVAPPVRTYTVTAARHGRGAVSPAGGASYAAGTQATYTAAADVGQVFLGWTLDGRYVGYASPVTFAVDSDRTLVATFAARPTFTDVPTTDADYQALTFLAALGIVNPAGVNGSGQFQPDRAVVRAEAAAFVARVFGWQGEPHASAFPDKCDRHGRDCVDDELWNNVAALADYGIVGGYTDPATCAVSAMTAPCYLPRERVLRVQVVSIVARAFIKAPALRATGFWDRLDADGAEYTNVPNSGTQRSDLTTYRANAGAIPGQDGDTTFPDPLGDGTRRFVIAALFQAFSAEFGIDRVP